MAKYRIVLLDSDVISHFIAVGMIDRLDEILAPNLLFLVDDVYNEVIRHPLDSNRKAKVDSWIASKHITRIPFPYGNEKIRTEFYRIKKAYPMLDPGERACMANQFIADAIRINHACFPVQRLEDYVPDRDLTWFLR